MGVLDSVFGTESSNEPQVAADPKYAVLLNAGPDQTPVAGNAFGYALELDDAGYEVQLFLDGKATRWPGAFAEDSDRPFGHEWRQLQERGLVVGACGYCANAFEAAAGCESSGVPLLSDASEHSPSVARLAEEGYELLTV